MSVRNTQRFLAALIVLFAASSVLLTAEPTPKAPERQIDVPNQKIEQALESTVDLDFDKTALGELPKYLEKKYSINVYLDRQALQDANVALDTQLTLRVKGISLRSAMRLLLRDLDLKWVPKDGVLWITTKDVADDLTETRAYPVLDLVQRPDADPIDTSQFDYYSIGDLLQMVVKPDSWPAGSGPGAIGRLESAGVILVPQTYENHEAIAETLAMLRNTRDQQFAKGKLKPIAERSLQPVLTKASAAPAIRKALADQFDFDYEEVPLTAVVEFLANKWNVPIMIDRKALVDANIAMVTPVSLTTKACPLGTGLELLLQPHDLAWVIGNDDLLITTKDLAEDLTSVRMYPVSDLDEGDEDRTNARRHSGAESLKYAIANGTGPDLWNLNGGIGALEYYPYTRTLVVCQTEKVHQDVEKLLTSLRQARAQQFPNKPEPPALDFNDESLHLKVYRVSPMIRPAGGSGMGGMGGGGFFAVDDDTQKQPESSTPVQQTPGQIVPAAAPPGTPQTNVPQSIPPQLVPPPPFDPTDDLVKIIPQVIESKSWKDVGGKATIHALPGRLIVLQTKRVHLQIVKFLRELQ